VVARAIYEHYLPTQAGGELPGSDCGALVSIADKLDTICGCFGVGLIPTGAADPYALRRSALGIINIILSKGYPLSLTALIDRSLDLLSARLTRPRPEVAADVLDFFRGRFVNLMTARYPVDVVDAVVAASFDDLVVSERKMAALAEFKTRPDFLELAVAFKRVSNIIKSGRYGEVIETSFREPIEGELYACARTVNEKALERVSAGDFLGALVEVSGLRDPVDRFFNDVMVMSDDEGLRNNRLALLGFISGIFSNIADFSRIST
jgi:glycyl-tRNA synthetase beta chain